MLPPILSLEALHVSYVTRGGEIPAVVDVSLRRRPGECLGLVAESGCGKTTVALATVRYLGANGRIAGGCSLFQGCDLGQPRQLAQGRGAESATV